MRTPKAIPTDQELEILKLVWQRGQATVREVYQDLLKQRKIAYTTVLTMMGILERKGHLKKTAGERAYVYSSAQPESQVVEGMVKEFVKRVFNGSPKPLLVHLVGDRELSTSELDEIANLVRDRRKKQ
jgi:predicted transcriptional regulator